MTSTLDELLAQRDELLKQHPELIPLQKEIDEKLSRTPEKNRAEVAYLMLSGKTLELNEALNKLLHSLYKGAAAKEDK